jgi:hypothetical protein
VKPEPSHADRARRREYGRPQLPRHIAVKRGRHAHRGRRGRDIHRAIAKVAPKVLESTVQQDAGGQHDGAVLEGLRAVGYRIARRPGAFAASTPGQKPEDTSRNATECGDADQTVA